MRFKIIDGQMGMLTSCDSEHIAHFLGEDRIKRRLEELDNKPTMGVSFADFLTSEGLPQGKGIFAIYGMVLQFFPELDVAEYLYKASKHLTKENYYNGPNMSKHWSYYIQFRERCKKWGKEIDEFQNKRMENQFWIEFHYFFSDLTKVIYRPKTFTINEELLNSVFETYYQNLDVITKEISNSWISIELECGLANIILKKMVAFNKKKKNMDYSTKILEKATSLGWRTS